MAIFLKHICKFPYCRKEFDSIPLLAQHVQEHHKHIPNKSERNVKKISVRGRPSKSVQGLNKNKIKGFEAVNVDPLQKKGVPVGLKKSKIIQPKPVVPGRAAVKQDQLIPPLTAPILAVDIGGTTNGVVPLTVDIEQDKIHQELTMTELNDVNVLEFVSEKKEAQLVYQSVIQDYFDYPNNIDSSVGIDFPVGIDENQSKDLEPIPEQKETGLVYQSTFQDDEYPPSIHVSGNNDLYSSQLIVSKSLLTCQINAEKPYSCPVPGCSKRYKSVNGIKYHANRSHGNAPMNISKPKSTNLIKRPLLYNLNSSSPPKRIQIDNETKEEIIDVIN